MNTKLHYQTSTKLIQLELGFSLTHLIPIRQSNSSRLNVCHTVNRMHLFHTWLNHLDMECCIMLHYHLTTFDILIFSCCILSESSSNKDQPCCLYLYICACVCFCVHFLVLVMYAWIEVGALELSKCAREDKVSLLTVV